jgi:hypothetical protein
MALIGALPVPDITQTFTDKNGKPTKEFFNYLKSLGGAGSGQFISVTDYGASGTGDATAAFQAANDAADAAGKALFIPSVPNGCYTITDTVTISCRHVFGETMWIDQGTLICWQPTVPTDMKPCFDCTGYDGAVVQDVSITGPTHYDTSTLYSDGIVSGAGLDNLNPALLNVPLYSSFADGVAGFGTSINGKVTFIRCSANDVKAALYLAGATGHCFSFGCDWGGGGTLFGVYCKINSEDYSFGWCNFNAAWAGILWGTTPYAGHNGGMDASYFKCHWAGNPYCFYQVDDSGIGASAANGYQVRMYDCALEAVKESVIRVLDMDNSSSTFMLDRSGFGWENDESVCLPPEIARPGQKQKYLFDFGRPALIKMNYDRISGGGSFTLSGMNVNARCARIYNDATDTASFDKNALLAIGPVDYVNGPSTQRDDRRAFPLDDWVHRQEQQIGDAVARVPTVLLNPEIAGNWTATNCTVTISTYSAVVAGILSGVPFPGQFYPELMSSRDAAAIVITPSATGWFAGLPCNPNPFGAGNNSIAMSCWVATAGADRQIRVRLSWDLFVNTYDTTTTINGFNGAQKLWGVGYTGVDGGGNTLLKEFQVFDAGAGSTAPLVLFGVMVCKNDLAQYNPGQGPGFSAAIVGSSGAAPVAFIPVTVNGVDLVLPLYPP